jgi:hypothetical protein
MSPPRPASRTGNSTSTNLGATSGGLPGTSAFLEVIINSVSAKVALGAMLRLLLHFQGSVGLTGWSVAWHSLSLLRDCVLLPRSMVLEHGVDLLPAPVRKDFDARVKASRDRKHYARQQAAVNSNNDKKRPKSYLSLSSLSEALFGSAQDERQEPSMQVFRSWRWDEGYEDQAIAALGDVEMTTPTKPRSNSKGGIQHAAVQSNRATLYTFDSAEKQFRVANVLMPEFIIPALAFQVFVTENTGDIPQRSHEAIIEETFQSLRRLVVESDIGRLVNDSRYLTENSLVGCLVAVLACTESSDDGCDRPHIWAKSLKLFKLLSESVVKSSEVVDNGDVVSSLGERLASLCASLPPSGESSCAWLEMQLVDITLRNRDRFALTWQLLDSHYRITLGATASLSYVTERYIFISIFVLVIDVNVCFDIYRRLVGLFKIASRMLSRDKFSVPILQLISTLLAVGGDSAASTDSCQSWVDLHDASDGGGIPVHEPAQVATKPSPRSAAAAGSAGGPASGVDGGADAQGRSRMRRSLVYELAAQISAGLWQLLTLNVAGLPTLQLDQWQTLFDLIAQVGTVGDFASIKAFESMAWLLHEPRLRAEVPVFCIVALKPLLLAANAPLTVSLGAVQLLSHLHTRLEVLIKDKEQQLPVKEFVNSVDGIAAAEDGTSALKVPIDYDHDSAEGRNSEEFFEPHSHLDDEDNTPFIWEVLYSCFRILLWYLNPLLLVRLLGYLFCKPLQRELQILDLRSERHQ